MRGRVRFHQQVKHILLVDLAEGAAHDESDRRMPDLDGGGGGLWRVEEAERDGAIERAAQRKDASARITTKCHKEIPIGS